MPNHLKDPLEIKVPISFSVRKKYRIAFDNKVEELGLEKNLLIENFMKEIINM